MSQCATLASYFQVLHDCMASYPCPLSAYQLTCWIGHDGCGDGADYQGHTSSRNCYCAPWWDGAPAGSHGVKEKENFPLHQWESSESTKWVTWTIHQDCPPSQKAKNKRKNKNHKCPIRMDWLVTLKPNFTQFHPHGENIASPDPLSRLSKMWYPMAHIRWFELHIINFIYF